MKASAAEDLIVAEVRETRRQIEESCGNSFEQLYGAAVEIQKQHKGQVIFTPASKSAATPDPASATPSTHR